MPRPIDQIPRIRSSMQFYRVMSWVTGVFLLLLVVEMILKYSPLHVELFAGDGRLFFAPVIPLPNCEWWSLFVPGGMGCKLEPTATGLNLSTAILVTHGWIYVVYIVASFRLWSYLRWPFKRLITMALGGVVPFLSFFTERRIHALAVADVQRLEAQRAARDGAPVPTEP